MGIDTTFYRWILALSSGLAWHTFRKVRRKAHWNPKNRNDNFGHNRSFLQPRSKETYVFQILVEEKGIPINMRIKNTVPKNPIWKKLVHTRPFLLEMEICEMQQLIALKSLSSVLFPRLLSMKLSGWGDNILNLEIFFGPRKLNRGVIVGEGISILPEAAGGSHYHYLHNLFSLRMLPNIIY